MASWSTQTLFSLSKPTKPNSRPFTTYNSLPSKLLQSPIFSRNKQRNQHLNNNKNKWVMDSVMQEELDVIPVQSQDSTDMQEGVLVGREDGGTELVGQASQVGAFSDGTLSFEGFSSASASSSSSTSIGERGESEDIEKMVDRTINATLVLAAGTFAITKLLTIDSDYWQLSVSGWTIYEILRYAPQHNWSAYEEALKTNPVLAKMMISGIVYSPGDWIAQCYEGKPLLEFNRAQMFRSGLVGFTLHGSLFSLLLPVL